MTTNDDILRALGRIEGKMDGVAEWSQVVDKRLNNHADRIGGLERWRAYLLGIAAVTAAVAGFAIKVLSP